MRSVSRALVAVSVLALWSASPLRAEPQSSADGTEETSHTPTDVFNAMRRVFQAEKARGLHIRYLFHFSNPQGGDWWITVDDGRMAMGKGSIEKPNCTIVCTGSDWVALDNETLSGMRAYMTGRLKILGDRSLAHKLNELFP